MRLDRAALNAIVEKWLTANARSLKELDAVLAEKRVSARTFRQMRNDSKADFSSRKIRATAEALNVPVESIVERDVQSRPFGSILAPAPDTVFESRQITVRGEAENIPCGSTLWLVVAIGSLHWPKSPSFEATGAWQTSVFEGGRAGTRFDLLLWAVCETGTTQIREWLRKGDEEDHYPGRSAVTGIVPLDRVGGLMVR